MAEPLELEESELFDTHDDIEEDELRHAHPKGVQAAVAEDSDDDHSSGLVLPGFEEDDDDTEELGASCASRPDGELMGPTDPRLIESALCAANLGTSAGGSHLGSLKSFEPRSLGRHWSSEGDLGVIAASLPAQSQFQAMAIRAPEPASDANYLVRTVM